MPQPTRIVITNTHLLRAAMLFMVLGIIGPGLFQLKPPRWFAETGGTGHPEIAAGEELAPALSPVVAPPPPPPAIAPAAQPPVEPDIQPETGLAAAPALEAEDVVEKIPDSYGSDTVASPSQAASEGDTPPDQAEQPAVAARKTVLASQAAGSVKVPAYQNPSSAPLEVMRRFTKSIPESHTVLPVTRQKENFIAITLPLILAANEEIVQRRNAIKRAIARGDWPTIERWARLYRIDTETESKAEVERQLLLRADFVPVSLALAQAAIESGWGTSRFALQGNALFGQWAWQKDAGLKPERASNSQAVVRSFPNLFGSVRAYMHNLNTHPRYAAFRARRYLLRGRTQAELGYQLSNFLDGYAEIGEVYVTKLKALIRSNNFGQYESARLH
ncbi:glucosaminidase domain-containing protein [Alphaproteobacteria bacterium LSUCC0719]